MLWKGEKCLIAQKLLAPSKDRLAAAKAGILKTSNELLNIVNLSGAPYHKSD
jgi:hypothetical protein